MNKSSYPPISTPEKFGVTDEEVQKLVSKMRAGLNGVSMDSHSQQMIDLIAKLQSLALAEGATAIVIGIAKRYTEADGLEHDAWQVRAKGPCLSTLGLISELRDYLEVGYKCSGVLRPTELAQWWKSHPYNVNE